jgi:DNA-binding response OmpR family regulator
MGFFEKLLRSRMAARATPAPSQDRAERRKAPRTQRTGGLTVLIVDDSKTMVAHLGRMMHENRFQVLEAFDGETAVEILDGVKVDLLFLDVILPGMSGFEVLRHLRRNPKMNPEMRIIVMSGNEAATEEYYVKRIGADEFMRKPCSRAVAFATVERVLNLPPHALDIAARPASGGQPSATNIS